MIVKNTIRTLLRDGFILVFNQNAFDVTKTAEALIEAGINNMEVTCRIEKPLEKIKRLRSEIPDFVVGAASLIDFAGMLDLYNRHNPADPLPSVDSVVNAGANYIVSAANFSAETYDTLRDKVAIIPGCGTVSEILCQFSMGANLVKIFPAKQLAGPAFVKAIDPAIHKTISLVPTGGTNADNIGDYISAGVLVVGCSFSMIEKTVLQRIIDRQDYSLLADELKKVKMLIDKLRLERWPSIDFANASVEQISLATGRDFNI